MKLSPSEKEDGTGMKVLKDLNFKELESLLKIPNKNREDIHQVLEKDSQFLAENNLMDYSLLFIKVN